MKREEGELCAQGRVQYSLLNIEKYSPKYPYSYRKNIHFCKYSLPRFKWLCIRLIPKGEYISRILYYINLFKDIYFEIWYYIIWFMEVQSIHIHQYYSLLACTIFEYKVHIPTRRNTYCPAFTANVTVAVGSEH